MKRTRKRLLAAVLSASLVLAASSALSDDYERQSAGHPLRIAAYVLHPVGVALDYLIFRPAHWIGSKQPLKAIFGHEDETPRISQPRRSSKRQDPDGTLDPDPTP